MEWLTVGDRYRFEQDCHCFQSAPDLNQSDSGDDVDHIGAAVARLSLNRVNMNVFPNSRWPVSERGLGQSWARSFVYKGVSLSVVLLHRKCLLLSSHPQHSLPPDLGLRGRFRQPTVEVDHGQGYLSTVHCRSKPLSLV